MKKEMMEKENEQIKKAIDDGIVMGKIEKMIGDIHPQELYMFLKLRNEKTAEDLIEELK